MAGIALHDVSQGFADRTEGGHAFALAIPHGAPVALVGPPGGGQPPRGRRLARRGGRARWPQGFLVGEPLSNLDAKLRVQMRAEILRIQRDLKVTTIYVTHDQTEAMTLGDLVVVMRRGMLQQVASPQEL